MASAPAVLDSDILSELSRSHATVTVQALAYLQEHGRLMVSAVSVFERLRGYRAALRAGKPFDEQLRQFQAFVATCRVLPVDESVAAHAAIIWAALSTRSRKALGDILIAATASAHGIALVTRNRRDFEPMSRIDGVRLTLIDWTKS
jgi:predicted nucleic acid-binding protein